MTIYILVFIISIVVIIFYHISILDILVERETYPAAASNLENTVN